MAELKLHLKCNSGMVQISVQAVKPKPHTETFLKYKKFWSIKKVSVRTIWRVKKTTQL